MDGNASFGYWVRRQRKALDLTQAELARRVGCAEGTIRMIEADARRPSRQIAALLAEQLAIAPADHGAFIRAARAELNVDRLAPPVQHISHAPSLIAQPALPSGMVTFLFTDIEGSTPLWEREPDQMRLALARHDAVLRMTIANHGGHAYKKIGDAFQAAFALPAQAVAAALAAQRALVEQPWETSDPVRVRMGLHIGSAVADGNDYSTTHTLNRVARIMSCGHGGQILLSVEVADLVRRDLPADVTLREMGKHGMKGLMQLEHLFQVVAPDLPAAFPPLRTVESRSTNLPAQPTPLIGRENEVAAVATLLHGTDARLLTLTGPGGVGKTHLALQAAVDLLDDFADGVYVVNLAPIADPDLVPSVIAQTLELREATGRPLLNQLQDYLHDKHMLLLLDNFEHLVVAAAVVADLLAACPRLTILVTSREILHLRGEKELPVPPLALPDLKRLPPLAALAQYAAVELFVARAQDVKHDYALSDESAPAVAEICYRLDGLPLAIELAAARIKLLAPQALLGQLGDRLKLLTGGARDLPHRQQTLRDTIDWSYNLLDVGKQMLFRRLGVFVGGCSLEAVAAVCSATQGIPDELPIDVLDGLTALVDKSFLRQAGGVDGAPRFVMLETIREYALERLVASGEEAALRQRHAQYYLALVERAEPLLHGAEQLVWLHRLEADYDNLRAVLAWSQVAVDGAAVGVRIVASLWSFWQFGGYLSEGREQLTRMLAHPEAAAPTVARARALFAAGFLIGAQGDFALAHARLTESHTLSCTIGYQHGVAYAHFGLGYVAWLQGEHTTARALHAESLALFRELGERWPIALSLRALGDDELYLDACERAVPLLEESLQLFRALGDQVMYGDALLCLGYAARLQGDDARAAACYAESLALFRDLRHVWGIAGTQLALGWLAQAQGDVPRAAVYFAASLVRYQELGHREGISLCLAGSAGAAGSLGQSVRAAQLFGAAEGLRAVIGIVVSGLPIERAVYEESVASVRAQLDQETFAAAWAMGRAMPLEQAIDIALDEEM
jgi:predicted ATPase/class 3 adenylate cyclase